jgi:ribonuclease J
VAENSNKLCLIPLGGLAEIGKNMMVVKYGNNILVVDAGLTFPEDELLGIDIVIPDISYLVEHQNLIRGIFLTHAHEDHIGAVPFILRDINAPIYGTKLTLGLLQGKLKESNVSNQARLNCIKPRDVISVGPFKVEAFRVSHSVADAVGYAIHTPVGTVVFTGDFKLDQTPIDGDVTDFYKLAELGERGVLALVSDSTNAERPGYTPSEKKVGQTFDDTFRQAPDRIIIASFASNIHRLQQVITTAKRHGRKVAVVGRSMVNVVSIASELGYLEIPPKTLVELDEILSLPLNKQVLLSTGSQGEPMSALTRMAMNGHKRLEIVPGDTIIISATPIPGNEKMVARTVDFLFRHGAQVIYENIYGIHVSGHASQEELKMMLNLIKPKFFVPVHGEYRMLVKHAQLAHEVGIPQENIFVLENGQSLEVSKNKARLGKRVPSGKVLVDGLGVGDVGTVVLRDRKQLSQDGILVVVLTLNKDTGSLAAGPDIVSRGFVYVRESEELLEEVKDHVLKILGKCNQQQVNEWPAIKNQVRDSLGKFIFEKPHRRPMILPIIMEI